MSFGDCVIVIQFIFTLYSSKRHISEDVFLTHELHCKRRIVLCKVCEEPIPRTEIEEHNKTEHGPVPCDLCGTEIPKHELENHKVSKFGCTVASVCFR